MLGPQNGSPIIFPRLLLLGAGALLAGTPSFIDDDQGYIPPVSQSAAAPVRAFAFDDDFVPPYVVADDAAVVVLPDEVRPPARAFWADDEIATVALAALAETDPAWLPSRALPVPPRVVVLAADDDFVPPYVVADDAAMVVLPDLSVVAVVPFAADDDLPLAAAPIAVDDDAGWVPSLPALLSRVAVFANDDQFAPAVGSVIDDDAGWLAPVIVPPRAVAPFVEADDFVPAVAPSLSVDDDGVWPRPLVVTPRAPLAATEVDDFVASVVPPVVDDDAGWSAPTLTTARAPLAFAESDAFVPPPVATLADDDSGWMPVPLTASFLAVRAMAEPDEYAPALALDDDAGWNVSVPRPTVVSVQPFTDDGSAVLSTAFVDDDSSAWIGALVSVAIRGNVVAVPVGARAAAGFDPDLYGRTHLAALRGQLGARPRLTGALGSEPRLSGSLGARPRLTATFVVRPTDTLS